MRAAALLLDFAVDDNGRMFAVMNSGPGKAIRSLVGIRKSRELAEREYQREVPDFEDFPKLGDIPDDEARTSL